MYNGRAGDFGDPPGELVAEKFALAVDHIRLPVDDLPDQLVAVGYGHAHIGIDLFQGHGADIGDGTLPVGVEGVGNGQDPDIVASGNELIEKVLNGSDHTVGVGGIQICGDQNFQGFLLRFHIFLRGRQNLSCFLLQIIPDFSKKSMGKTIKNV